jgi:phosphoglucomutase/phosphomannomutase
MGPPEELVRSIEEAERAGWISTEAGARIRRWLTEAPFAPYRDLLRDEIRAGRWRALDDAFYAVLEFGTGGRRGRMHPVGTHVLNHRTIGESARGLADFVIARKGADAPRSCVIGHDTRHNSEPFAVRCAEVLAAAGFQVYLFAGPRSTPLLSFAVRHLRCDAGIMITASHNPPSDNGFKCYNAQGGQVIPPDDGEIIRFVEGVSDREIPDTPLAEGLSNGSIVRLGPEIDQAYLDAVVSESVSHARDISIVFTPMHGVGEGSVAAALTQAGFTQVEVLAEQRQPDGDFPNVPGHLANPENPRTLEPAIRRAREIGADLVLASDPDADRVGVAVPLTDDPRGEWICLDGNQIGVLLCGFVIKQTEALGRLRSDHYLITTLVSSQMARALAEREGVRIEDDLLVGFKWVAERIDESGPAGFLFAFEESHGYQKGNHVRDKDAATGALLVAELAAEVKARKQTVLEYLDDLYIDVGHFAERQVSTVMEGREGAARMKAVMAAFRTMPPTRLGGLLVTEVHDYLTGEARPITAPGPIRLLERSGPPSDLLIYQTTDPAARVAVRPSGTEPKIKFYFFGRTETQGVTDRSQLSAIKQRTHQQLDQMVRDVEQYMATIGSRPSQG